eukprot:3553385-Alexandrium_andersonii.AAC.1
MPSAGGPTGGPGKPARQCPAPSPSSSLRSVASARRPTSGNPERRSCNGRARSPTAAPAGAPLRPARARR